MVFAPLYIWFWFGNMLNPIKILSNIVEYTCWMCVTRFHKAFCPLDFFEVKIAENKDVASSHIVNTLQLIKSFRTDRSFTCSKPKAYILGSEAEDVLHHNPMGFLTLYKNHEHRISKLSRVGTSSPNRSPTNRCTQCISWNGKCHNYRFGFSPNASNVTPAERLEGCLWILYAEIEPSQVRIWDLALLVPNLLFLLFLIIKSKVAITKLRQSNRPIFFTFYALVCTVAIISVARDVVSMMVNAATEAGDITDTILWVITKFFLLATEISVVIFGVGFSHLDSKSSIKRILLITSGVSLAYSVTQGVLEIVYPDTHYVAPDKYDIYSHGGMIFWCVSSTIFFVLYSVVLILPLTSINEKLQLPVKRSFYFYIGILSLLNFLQALGSALVYKDIKPAICIVDVTTFVYFTCFAPLIYLTFLHSFLKTSKQPLLLSYKDPQEENYDDESHHLPNSYASGKDDLQNSQSLYDSTEFGRSLGREPGPIHINNPILSINATIEYAHS
ncbi:transmembrane protein adipocyte-associated 1 homolog [Amphiura filiformis]|uniref:transmembrane protein adipocyte-associated 1 homolog n=1 Tax=Amphiura filiformis TaxID=82378 RepID=UPI003B2126D6